MVVVCMSAERRVVFFSHLHRLGMFHTLITKLLHVVCGSHEVQDYCRNWACMAIWDVLGTGKLQEIWYFVHIGNIHCHMACTVYRNCAGTQTRHYLPTGNVQGHIAYTLFRIGAGTLQDTWHFLHTGNIRGIRHVLYTGFVQEHYRKCDISCTKGNVPSCMACAVCRICTGNANLTFPVHFLYTSQVRKFHIFCSECGNSIYLYFSA